MDVVFAVLPFADVDRPAIGVSLLKAEADRLGFSSRIVYCNFDLAEAIGIELYNQISESLPSESLIGEWFFADLLFGERIPFEQEYVTKILARFAQRGLVNQILEARQRRRELIETSVEKIRALNPKVVGFTTTFHQTCACLAVAERLKKLPDPPIVIFGGANCEGEMGLQLLKSFPYLDYVCTREGDVAFPLFLQQVLRGEHPGPIPGILQQGVTRELSTPEMIRDLDALPLPDYTDYFERLDQSPLKSKLRVDILVETSRGCWWGAKHHCTFCGLNGDTMEFRSKSPDRAFEEMKTLTERYGIKRVSCVDNILDLRFVPVLFPRLKESGLDLELFYEVKANLKQEQVATMRSGGVKSVQPGIESFSNHVLRLMDKGCTGLQNIQLLRWCEESGIMPAWNLLSGFPGEDPAEYHRMAELLPLLTHLQPPSSCSPIRLDRFSPFFTKSDRFGIQCVRPSPAYYYVYPFGRRELAQMAYFFDFDYPDGREPREYVIGVKNAIDEWYKVRNPEMRAENYAKLDATIKASDEVLITDTRRCAEERTRLLTGLEAQVLLRCDTAQTAAGLAKQLGRGEPDIRAALGSLIAAKLIVEMEAHFGSLPVWRNRPAVTAKPPGDLYAHVRTPEAKAAESLLRVI
jgi:ribosomal peptide maturation radical SAM protein 1